MPINAGFFRRLAALIYDLFVLAAILLLGTLVLIICNHGHAITPNNHWYQFYLLSLLLLFYLGFWYYRGQTLGMAAWRIRLVAANGNKINFYQALARFCLLLLNLVFFGLGFIWLLIAKNKLAFYDRYSGTKIIKLI